MNNNYFNATWDAPSNVKTLITTRNGGTSAPPYASFNLATHVGDDINTVIHNRQFLQIMLPCKPIWLKQTHSCNVLIIDSVSHLESDLQQPYDAVIITQPNIVGCIMTADCAPILLTNQHGDFVAGIHAGWVGMANNIIGTVITQLSAMDYDVKDIIAYIGVTICQAHFEVGREVYQKFLQLDTSLLANFKELPNNKFLCDLSSIAKAQLVRFGIRLQNIYNSELCTYCNTELFYSYRRDGITGRIASLIWMSVKVNASKSPLVVER